MEDGAHSDGASSPAHRDGFATTRWTVVFEAGDQAGARGGMAMEELCRTYWYPLYAYVRRRGHSREDAEDLTQAFFARLCTGNDLSGLSPERGRFRAFLLAALKHFLANEWDKSQRLKRGGGTTHVPLDCGNAETRYLVEPADHLSPDRLYDRAWAVTLLERVVARLETLHADNPAFPHLKPCLMLDSNLIDHAAAAAALAMSEGAVRVASHRLRRQYRELLRAEIAITLADPARLETELQALLGAFAE